MWTEEERKRLNELGYSEDAWGEFSTMGDYGNNYEGNSARKDGENEYVGKVVVMYTGRDSYDRIYENDYETFDNFESLINFIDE